MAESDNGALARLHSLMYALDEAGLEWVSYEIRAEMERRTWPEEGEEARSERDAPRPHPSPSVILERVLRGSFLEPVAYLEKAQEIAKGTFHVTPMLVSGGEEKEEPQPILTEDQRAAAVALQKKLPQIARWLETGSPEPGPGGDEPEGPEDGGGPSMGI